MEECLPSFNNIQERILKELDCDFLEYPDGMPRNKNDGHLQKLIERGFVRELPNGNYTLTTDLYGEPLCQQTQWKT